MLILGIIGGALIIVSGGFLYWLLRGWDGQ